MSNVSLCCFLEKNDLLSQLDSERNGSSEIEERLTRLGKFNRIFLVEKSFLYHRFFSLKPPKKPIWNNKSKI